MKNIAIILAGGIGNRLGNSIPKQFFKVAGKTVIEHTVDVFERCEKIDEIAVVIYQSGVMHIEEMILTNNWKKVKKILLGGDERYMSSLSAINAYKGEKNCNLIFHDAVRPLVNERIINDVISALKKYNAVNTAVPATDTIIEVENNAELIRSIPNRSNLRRGQTPQGFKLETITRAYEIALQNKNFVSTDDCGVVIKYLPDEKVYVVRGEEFNLKLTYKEDAFLLDKLFQLRSLSFEQKIDLTQLKGKIIVVFGGNSGIGAKIVEIADKYGAKTFPFSRSLNNIDISNRNSVKNALAQTYKETQRIDYIVNTAAILTKEPLINMSEQTLNDIIRTNYDGAINVAIESYEYLKQSAGQLLLYTSSSYTRGRAFYSIYSSTKAAIVNFAQALAQEWEKSKIRINVINPQRTKTPMRIKNFGTEPDNTLLSADMVAETSIYTLLSDFTGQIIDVKK